MIRIVCACFVMALLLIPGLNKRASAQSCPIPINDRQVNGYKLRSDRCEGIYRRDVYSTYGVQLVSVSAASALNDLCDTPNLRFVWPAATSPMRLQVESFRHGLYYRLDANRPARSTGFDWPTDPRCSNEVRLTRTEIGTLATTSAALAGRAIEVMLPVTFASEASTAVAPPYDVVILPGRSVNEVYVSLWHYGDPQRPTSIFSERPLKQTPYPPGVRISIRLTSRDVAKSGIYRLKASVDFQSGTPETIDIYFLASH